MGFVVCPNCGTPCYVEDSVTLRLTPTQRRTYEYIRLNQPVTTEQIMTHLYGQRVEDWPKPNVIAVQVSYINATLLDYGVKIENTRGPWAAYRIIKVGPSEGTQNGTV